MTAASRLVTCTTPAPSATPAQVVGGAFADPDRIVRSWYVVARARQVRAGRPTTVDVLDRRITLWRASGGAVVAFDARCPHLGADLGQGRVIDGSLRCAFHHWRFDPEGRCTDAPGEPDVPDRCTKRYSVRESHGLVWVYNGDAPAFDLPGPPEPDSNQRWRRWVPPAQAIACHPHLVVGNGLDARHFSALHGMETTTPPRLETLDAYRLRLHLRGRPTNPWVRSLLGARKREVVATFTITGGHIAWAAVKAPLPLHVLFTARPEPGGCCTTQTALYLPRGFGLHEARAVALMGWLLHSDRKILEKLDFHPGYTPADEPFARYTDLVNAMEVER